MNIRINHSPSPVVEKDFMILTTLFITITCVNQPVVVVVADQGLVDYGQPQKGRWDNTGLSRRRSTNDWKDSRITTWGKHKINRRRASRGMKDNWRYNPVANLEDEELDEEKAQMMSSHFSADGPIMEYEAPEEDEEEDDDDDDLSITQISMSRRELKKPRVRNRWRKSGSRRHSPRRHGRDMHGKWQYDRFAPEVDRENEDPSNHLKLHHHYKNDDSQVVPLYNGWGEPRFTRQNKNGRLHKMSSWNEQRIPSWWEDKQNRLRIARQDRDVNSNWGLDIIDDNEIEDFFDEKPLLRKSRLPPCDEDQLMTYLAQLQAINPESVVQLSSVNNLNVLCSRLNNSLDEVDAYLKTCTPCHQPDLYMKLLDGVRTLRFMLCIDSKYRAEFSQHAPCLSQLHTEYEDCVGPTNWPESPDTEEVCKVYRDIYDCYYIKSAYLCGLEGANVMKKLTRSIIDSVLTVKCDNLLQDPVVPDAMLLSAPTDRSRGHKIRLWPLYVAIPLAVLLPIAVLLCLFRKKDDVS
ncbi:uncharacterized protein [Anabrus simplex]|uniref:uncharacterized protein isoform X2 n=1 Tax=Anabrus simplex TaxID=316456 RepID=UPI0035A27144